MANSNHKGNSKYFYLCPLVYCNSGKIHKSLSITPAMQAGWTKRAMSVEVIATLAQIEASKKRRPYKKNLQED